jgi:hypothetical protein
MPNSVWPNDTFLVARTPVDEKRRGKITCFLMSPFNPSDRWDDLFILVRDVCNSVGNNIGVTVECVRADTYPSSGIIQSEIWDAIKNSDFLICDVSGQNGNVMLELGVASAWRKKEQVIILRQRNDNEKHLFDINPARHIEYDISFEGFKKLFFQLQEVILNILASLPFQSIEIPSINLPFEASLDDGKDRSELFTEDITHRRLLNDCLEYGAPYIYRNSWMSLGDLNITNVHVKAEMKITYDLPGLNKNPWMGIMIRGSSNYANLGHLIYINKEGKIIMTVPEGTGQYEDKYLDTISNFDCKKFTAFDITMDDHQLVIKIGLNFGTTISLIDLPYIYSRGRIFFIAAFCRVGIKNILVEIPQSININEKSRSTSTDNLNMAQTKKDLL